MQVSFVVILCPRRLQHQRGENIAFADDLLSCVPSVAVLQIVVTKWKVLNVSGHETTAFLGNYSQSPASSISDYFFSHKAHLGGDRLICRPRNYAEST